MIKIMLRLLSITIFVLVATMWMWHAFAMDMDKMGQMNDCPFMDVAIICAMAPLEHINILKGLFTSIFQESLLLAVLAFVLILMSAIFSPSQAPHRLFRRGALLFEKYLNINKPLQEAFSSGIIHSKIYSVSIS